MLPLAAPLPEQSGQRVTRLYTITTAQVSEALAALGIEVDKKVITIDEAVKTLGEATATAKLHREVKAEIKLNVIAE